MLTITALAATLAIVTQDQAPLRAAPSATAATHAQMAQGDLVEVRGKRLDHLQVYDHRRERAGYLRASQLRALSLDEAEAPQLLAVLRFVRDTPGAESLGIAYAAAYLKAAPAAQITAEPLDALGVMAERLARRAGTRAAVGAHLESVAQYGVRFTSVQQPNSVRLCYDGDAFARVAAMGAARATPEQRARAALALTRDDCIDAGLTPSQRYDADRARAEQLHRIDGSSFTALDEQTRNRLRLRRASVWSALAFAQSRRGESAQAAAQHAIDEMAAVNKAELGDDEQAEYQEAAVRVGAVRWAALPAPMAAAALFHIEAGEPGQTCVRPLQASASRCTYGTVWSASARRSPDGRVIVLTVQPVSGWSELWVWRRQADGWRVDVLPPDANGPGVGYVEWAGWVGSPRKLLLAREAVSGNGKHTRRFEVLDLNTLGTERSASTPSLLAAFARHADLGWKRQTLSLR